MAVYGINLKDNNDTFTMEAEFYEIMDGFVRLYHYTEDGVCEEFASYAADNVRHIVLQPDLHDKGQ